MHLTFDGVNDAFRGLVHGIHTGEIPTVRRPSRNGDVLQIDEPVTITYRKPTRRVLFNAVRDANPFFHVYEALWMLAGRNDVAPLTYYNSRMREFSDDGKVLNGAYGYRWRYAWNGVYDPPGDGAIDQLDLIVDHLKADSNSRRAVLQMWNVESDLLCIGPDNSSKDVCCLSWDTKFRSPEGDTDIQELSRRFQSNPEYRFPVYSVDTETGNQKLSWMTNAWKTGIRQVLKINFDDGSSVRTTGEHIFFKNVNSWTGGKGKRIRVVEECQASELCVGDRVVAEMPEHAVSRTRGGGYRVFRRNIYSGTEFSNLEYEHREYLDLIGTLEEFDGGSGWLVHHKDENKTNNRLSNLEQIRVDEHGSKHMMGADNPWYKRSEESRKQQSERTRNRSKEVKDRFKNAGLAAQKKLDRELPDELRKALYTKASCRSSEQQRMVDEWKYIKNSNHKIVSIERIGQTTVYDFTVPGRHNAVLSNGVVVHNCNLSVMFSLRNVESEPTILPDHANPGRHNTMTTIRRHLDMTVTNRSNDLIWGLLGANVVHFSFLQEYLAARLGVEVGRYNQFTNNLHVYTERWKPEEWLAYRESGYDGWESFDSLTHRFSTYPEGVEPFPLVKDSIAFDRELPLFVKRFSGKLPPEELAAQWSEPFFNDVAQPMLIAFSCAKEGDYYSALLGMEEIAAQDWRVAATQWLERRANRRKENTVDNLEA